MKIIQIAQLWLNLGYGELLHTLSPISKILIVLFLHSFLVLAVVFPGTWIGLYGTLTTILIWVWNILWDKCSKGFLYNSLSGIEKKAQLHYTTTWVEHLRKVLLGNLRLTLLFPFTLLIGIVCMILGSKG